jgi:hypothetical protein
MDIQIGIYTQETYAYIALVEYLSRNSPSALDLDRQGCGNGLGYCERASICGIGNYFYDASCGTWHGATLHVCNSFCRTL